jgi:RNA polymerase sigma factor (sigma-70 family)
MGTESQTHRLADDLSPTRYSLLSRLQNWDDQESWRVFFDTYWRLIYSVALKAGLTESEAQEVVQETVICVARNIHKFKRDRRLGSFKGWLCHLTRWRIADQIRKRTGLLQGNVEGAPRQYQPLEDIPDLADDGGGPEWEQEWQSNLLRTAMQRVKGRVKEEHYQIFDLSVVQGWPVRRIGQTLGVSAAQVYLVRHRVSRLLQKEVKALTKEWDEHAQ